MVFVMLIVRNLFFLTESVLAKLLYMRFVFSSLTIIPFLMQSSLTIKLF